MGEAAIRRCRPLLGTFVEIVVPAGSEAALEAAFAKIARVHARMSFHEETSDLAALRRAKVGAAVHIDPATISVLRMAIALHARSDGVFDVAIGSRLVALGYLPRPAGADLRHMTGTTADIEIVSEHLARCHRPMMIDLGGIAKGFAVDCAIEHLIAAGVDRGIVNAGGDLRVIGTDTVALRGADNIIGTAVEICDAALASSSNRHLRRRHKGREVAPHLARNRSGLLAENAVAVIAGECMIADAMTKIALADPHLADVMLAELGGAIIADPAASIAA